MIFLAEDEDTSTKEMSLNNGAGMQLRLQQLATCAIVQQDYEAEVCERCRLYVPHDLMLMRTLWMALALFIVITEVYFCGFICKIRQRVLVLHMWTMWSAYLTTCTCEKEGEVWKTEEGKTGRREMYVCVCVREREGEREN